MGAPLPSVFAMRFLTYTFVALVLPLAVATLRQPGARRALWAAALSIFAVSALHLSQFHQGDPSWPVELLGHHASLPLALAILYQDFQFALADLFLKRALTLLALVAAAFVAFATVGARSSSGAAPLRGAGDVGVLITLWVVTALLYPKLRDLVGWFVDTVVLARSDYEALRAEIGQQAQRSQRRADDVERRLCPAGARLQRPGRPVAGRLVRGSGWSVDGRDPSGRATSLFAGNRRADRRAAAALGRSRGARNGRRLGTAHRRDPYHARAL